MTDDSGCPECGGQRLQAGRDYTLCVDCGHTFQSGLQELAKRFPF